MTDGVFQLGAEASAAALHCLVENLYLGERALQLLQRFVVVAARPIDGFQLGEIGPQNGDILWAGVGDGDFRRIAGNGLSLEGDIPENLTPRQRLLQSIVVGEGDILLPQVQIGGVQGIGLTLHKDVGVLIIDIGQCAPCCRNGKHGNDDENGHQLIAFLLFQSVFLRIFELPPIIIQLNQNCNRIL